MNWVLIAIVCYGVFSYFLGAFIMLRLNKKNKELQATTSEQQKQALDVYA